MHRSCTELPPEEQISFPGHTEALPSTKAPSHPKRCAQPPKLLSECDLASKLAGGKEDENALCGKKKRVNTIESHCLEVKENQKKKSLPN